MEARRVLPCLAAEVSRRTDNEERSPMPTGDDPEQPDLLLQKLVTEQPNTASLAIDTMSALQIVQLMNVEDAVVAAAVAHELPAIASAVEAIAARLQVGGRLIYL